MGSGGGVRGLILGMVVVLIPSWSAALDPRKWEGRKKAPAEPIEIRADRMELRRQENVAIYSGRVRASEQDYVIRSERLEVRWDPATQKISELVAEGDVQLETEDARGTCGTASLDVATKAVTMRDAPRLVQGGEFVEGDSIVYAIAERKSTVLGGKGGRVRTLVIPGGRR